MAQDYSEAAALKLAKQTVAQLEKANPGNMNGVLGGLAKMDTSISSFPTSDEIFRKRVGELAGAYAHVSDGEGGVKGATKQAMEKYKNALAGKMASGVGYLQSQSVALLTGKTEHLVEDIAKTASQKKLFDVMFEVAEDGAKGIQKNAGKLGLAGKAFGAVAGIGVTVMSGNASAASITEAGLNGVSNGLGTLTVGDSSGGNRLCKIFGDVVVPGAVGIGVGAAASLVSTPVGGTVAGVAASAAASATMSEPATKGCNSFVQKLGF